MHQPPPQPRLRRARTARPSPAGLAFAGHQAATQRWRRFVVVMMTLIGAALLNPAAAEPGDLWEDAAHLSGSWYDPAKDGQGMVMQVIAPSQVLMTWFTFDPDGEPAWLQGVGELDGTRLHFDALLRFEGPKFGPEFDPQDRIEIPTGTMTVDFASCHAARAEFSGMAPFVDDTLNLERLTTVAGFDCDGNGNDTRSTFPLHHGLSGAWYAPQMDGQGWMVEVLNKDEALVYWFTYDDEGRQRWLLGVGGIDDEAIEVNNLQWAQGAAFGPDFDPADVERVDWGAVTLSLYPCQDAHAAYRKGRAHRAEAGTIDGVEPLAGIVGSEPCPKYIDQWVASRVVEQTTFGPNPEDEAEIRRLGIEGWVDEQLATPPSLIEWKDMACESNFFTAQGRHKPTEYPYWEKVRIQAVDHFVGAPDQLRLRLTWALSQLLVVSDNDIDTAGTGAYFNMLQRFGLRNYRDILKEVTLSPAMGLFLDNAGSYATSDACPDCVPNENYSRELLMLFTLGVNQLNMDGTVKTDPDGRPLEVFSQQDVMELARALTGWRFSRFSQLPPDSQRRRELAACPTVKDYQIVWDGHMVPETEWPPNAHDPGRKELLGETIPAGQGIRQDLETVLDILMDHPNMAPFVSYRLIQHLTTSNPSPDYVRRVAEVFADNGQGVSGDMKAVVKAIIMDPEARAGDDPDRMPENFGRIRDLVQHHTGVWRGMSCTRMPTRRFDSPDPSDFTPTWRFEPRWPNNEPFGAREVFNFYPPDNTVTGMDLISPEHMILNAQGIEARLSSVSHDMRYMDVCDFDLFVEAADEGPEALVSLISERYLRGRDDFDHRAVLIDMAETVPDTLRAFQDPSSRYYQPNNSWPLQVLIGYSLLGEEYGVVR